MADELLSYYEKELAFIRQLGAEFAQEHPKIAGRLSINEDAVEDPHVSRLIESFAYLNARIQHKLDDDFPEISDALLSVLFPHYQRPIPSMSIVHFDADDTQLGSTMNVPRNTFVDSEKFQGQVVRFATVYETILHPVKVASANIFGRPFSTPGSEEIRGAQSVLRLSLKTFNPDLSFAEVQPDSFRFYLKGQPQHIHPLYQMLLNECYNVVLSTGEGDTNPIFLGPDVIQPVGFDPDDNILPYPPCSFAGYRLLTEFFIFPEKFMFIDIGKIAEHIPEHAKDTLELYMYFGSTDVELEHNISEETFILGCTPVVNLFPHEADPITLDHTRQEYQIIPDSRHSKGYEVYSVDKVIASSSSGEIEEYLPFYGLNHAQQSSLSQAYWFASRRDSKLGIYERDEGTDVFLNLVDLHFNPNIPEDRTIMVKAMCSNRDLPAKLPYTPDQPVLVCSTAPPCKRIRCLTQPSAVVRPPLRNHARWRLISHLNLNNLSLTGRNEATKALKELLRLYDFRESSVTRALVESVLSVQARPISAPLNIDGHATMCRGMEIEIELDDLQLTGSSPFLYASILEHFFAVYVTINSFTRVLIKVRSKEGYLKKCPPRAGEKIFL